MPKSKNKFLTLMIIMTLLIIVCLFIVPAPYKWMGALSGYFVLLVVSLGYQKEHKKCMAKIKELDANHQYQQLVEYINEVKPLGYKGFVVDSYLLYAHYELGDFKAYEQTVLSMRQTRAWKRPKFEDFRGKVVDNLACIAFLKQYADTGEIVYKGNNLMMMQAINYYKEGNKDAIVALMNEYPKVPKLKKTCMYVLSGNFEALEGYYVSDVAMNVIKDIKERENNG